MHPSPTVAPDLVAGPGWGTLPAEPGRAAGGLWCTSPPRGPAGRPGALGGRKRSQGGGSGRRQGEASAGTPPVLLPGETRWVPWGDRRNWKTRTCAWVLPRDSVGHRRQEQPHFMLPAPASQRGCGEAGGMPKEGAPPAFRCPPTPAPLPRRIALSEPARDCAFPVANCLCQRPQENRSRGGGMPGRAKGQGNLC